MQSIRTKGGVGGSVITQGGCETDLLRSKGWEVVVIVNTTS